MLILEAMKKTSSAKPRNPCQSKLAEDCLNYSTQIPTGLNYNIPPKYMIYECTLAEPLSDQKRVEQSQFYFSVLSPYTTNFIYAAQGDFRLPSCPISTDVNYLRTLAFQLTIGESHPCLILRSRLVHRLIISSQRLAQFCRYIYIKIVPIFLLSFVSIHIFPNLHHIVQ